MNRVEPRIITSPISGQPCVPRIIETRVGKNIVKEAHWIDPASGAFIRKGVIEVKPYVSEDKKS
jgi:hypothetical protein